MPTLYGSLEKGLAGFAGRHSIMIPGGEVPTHQTESLWPGGAHWGQEVAPQDGVHLQEGQDTIAVK